MVTFGDTITNSCFIIWLPHCVLFSPVFHFVGQSWMEKPETLFCAQVTEEMQVECNQFLSLIVFIPELLMTHCSILEKKKEKKVSPREKVWSTGFYPNLFLAHDDW